jgi:Tol biopolymer transport system component
VASALDYAHRQGVVHRDIKPENILFHEGEVVLADFGIALAVKEAGGNRLTETGLSLGTPQYMSPEQATGDRTLDARSDVYSLAAVLYEMLAGEPPVSGATAQAIIAKLLTERPTSIRVVRDTVPVAVDAAVTKALSKVPADRFASAGDFVRSLDIGAAAPLSGSRTTRGLVFPMLGAAAVVMIGLGAWFIIRGLGQQPKALTLGDRTQVTFNGRVLTPSISRDGAQIAYGVRNCNANGCTYGVELQDIGGSATRRLFDGASALYAIYWGPERRSLLLEASINGSFGLYLVSTLGGQPRRVSPVDAAFWGSDSLLTVRAGHAHPDYWIFVGGLDGAAVDSIRVPGLGNQFGGVDAVPNSGWIIFRTDEGQHSTLLALDRAGHEHARITLPSVTHMNATPNGIWLLAPGATRRYVVRVGFDTKTGRFAPRADTVYRLAAPNNSYSVTYDGSTLLFDEGVAEYDVWATDLKSAVHGNWPREKSILHSTSAPIARLSPDGSRLLIGRTEVSSTSQRRWSIMPFDGKGETPLALGGENAQAYWADAATIAVIERGAGATRFSLMNAGQTSRRSTLTIRDSTITDWIVLPNGGWGWLSDGGRTLALQPAGASSPRRMPIPRWYSRLDEIYDSPDGSKIAVVGWSAPSGDSIGVSTISVADGKETHLLTKFAEGGSTFWLDDGSVLFASLATGATYSLDRIRGPGQIEHLGNIGRPGIAFNVSTDLRRISLVGREEHSDAWTARVVTR